MPEADYQILITIFNGNQAEADKFLDYAHSAGVKPKHIADRVKGLAKSGMVDTNRIHQELWEILNRCGLYPHTRQSWNKTLRAQPPKPPKPPKTT